MTKSSAKPNATIDPHEPLRKQLYELLQGGQAHATFDDAIKDFPAELRGKVPPNLPYSAWQLLEHMRITQRDILNFSAPPTGGYHGLEWPAAYWPKFLNHPPLSHGTVPYLPSAKIVSSSKPTPRGLRLIFSNRSCGE